MSKELQHKEKMKKLQKLQREKVKEKNINRGVVIVNTGNGKGKSTAAFGTAIRAAGYGYKVAVVQFIKGSWKTGGEEAFKRFPEIDHIVSGKGFTWDTQNKEADIAAVYEGWNKVLQMVELCRSGEKEYHLIILDELNLAVSFGYLPVQKVIELIEHKPEKLNLIITGRGAPAELISLADTVTEMVEVKHAFEQGIQAQKGIEF